MLKQKLQKFWKEHEYGASLALIISGCVSAIGLTALIAKAAIDAKDIEGVCYHDSEDGLSLINVYLKDGTVRAYHKRPTT